MEQSHLSQDMRACVEQCLTCYSDCEETKAHCLGMGGKHSAPEHLNALADCAVLCATSAQFMLRGSDLHRDVCGVCAEACDRCAASCDAIGADDDTMRRCARSCRTCAESCRAMAG